MKKRTRILSSFVILLIAALALPALEAYFAIQTNSIIVNQLNNSSSAALAAQYTGNGVWIARSIVSIPATIALALIWLKKPNKK